MKQRQLLILCTISALVAFGCADGGASSTPDGGSTSTPDGGQSVPPGHPLGAACVTNESCDSGNCNPDSSFCVGPAGECSAAESACRFAWECCSGNCGGGICTDPVGSCHAFADACITDGNCCTGNCQAMSCALRVLVGGGAGDPCVHDNDCIDDICLSGKCVAASCDPAGTPCTPGADDGTCCSGACSEVSGTCTDVPVCLNEGELCGAHWECCDGLCNPYSDECEPVAPPPT